MFNNKLKYWEYLINILLFQKIKKSMDEYNFIKAKSVVLYNKFNYNLDD
jgi:hypothetical protein